MFNKIVMCTARIFWVVNFQQHANKPSNKSLISSKCKFLVDICKIDADSLIKRNKCARGLSYNTSTDQVGRFTSSADLRSGKVLESVAHLGVDTNLRCCGRMKLSVVVLAVLVAMAAADSCLNPTETSFPLCTQHDHRKYSDFFLCLRKKCVPLWLCTSVRGWVEPRGYRARTTKNLSMEQTTSVWFLISSKFAEFGHFSDSDLLFLIATCTFEHLFSNFGQGCPPCEWYWSVNKDDPCLENPKFPYSLP